MDLKEVKDRWVNYNYDLIDKFNKEAKLSEDQIEKLKYFASTYLIESESDLEEDPNNEDYGIITLDTVTAGYIDGFLGRRYIQENENIAEKDIVDYIRILHKLFTFLRENGLYKERAAQYTKLMKRLENEKKYTKRLAEYKKIQEQKDDEETYLDLMREWEYEDL